MAKKKAPSGRAIQSEITDLIAVLCDLRKETYPFEKYVALLTFSTWLHWPQDPRIVRQGRIVAAALVSETIISNKLQVEQDKKQEIIQAIREREMSPREVNDALINRALVGSYTDNLDSQLAELGDVSGIAAFLFRCPSGLKPSINKAMYFIAAEGYVDEDDPDNKASVATLKKSWVKYAIVSPFIFSAYYWEDELLYSLAPDDPNSIKVAKRYLSDSQKIIRFFQLALQVQQQMTQRLDSKTLSWLKLTKFPVGVEPATEDVLPLDENQLAILKKYKAPVPSV